MGQIKCKMTPPNLNVCHCPSLAVLLPLYCDVTPSLSLASSVSVCLLCSGPVQWGSALFEKREKSLVPVRDAVSSSGGLTAVGPRRP